MVHGHGAQAQQLVQATRGVDPAELVAVPVDVGKRAAMALVCAFTGELLARPFVFPMTMAGVRLLVEWVQAATCGRAVRLVRVGWRPPGIITSRWSAPGCCRRLAAGPGQPSPGGRPAADDRPAAGQDRRVGSGGDQ
jgi:hypothetical protein